jgi:hypothetical protein
MRYTCVLLLASLSASAAPCKLVGKPWLSAQNVDVLDGQPIEIRLMGRARIGGRERVLTGAEWKVCDADIRWRRIEPQMEHVDTPSPNKDISVYANAVVFGPSHGTWIGYDKIEYFETDLDGDGPTLTVRDARPTDDELAEKRAPELRGLGVMRVQATVNGITTAPLRYSYRNGDDFLGWLSSFYNVPYLFGSAGMGAKNQAEQYIGADCADILVAALRRAGWKKLEYSSVADLVDALHPVGKPVIVKPCQAGACEATALRYGKEVRPGDMLALDYIGAESDLPRAWDHIVVVVEDRGPGGVPDGKLGPEDLVMDSGSAEGLKQAPLGEQGLVRVAVLRPPPRK